MSETRKHIVFILILCVVWGGDVVMARNPNRVQWELPVVADCVEPEESFIADRGREIDVRTELESGVKWLFKNGVPVHPVCGVPKDGRGERYICYKEAGWGTTHFGVGPCMHHDEQRLGEKLFGELESKKPGGLVDRIHKVKNSEEVLKGFEPNLLVLHAMLVSVIQETEDRRAEMGRDGMKGFLFSSEEEKQILRIIDRLTKAKEAQSKAEQGLLMKSEEIMYFTQNIVEAVIAKVKQLLRCPKCNVLLACPKCGQKAHMDVTDAIIDAVQNDVDMKAPVGMLGQAEETG